MYMSDYLSNKIQRSAAFKLVIMAKQNAMIMQLKFGLQL